MNYSRGKPRGIQPPEEKADAAKPRGIRPGTESTLQSSGAEVAIELRSQSLARFVELSVDGVDVAFSDNYIDLPAHRTVRVTCPLPDGWSVEQVRQALKIRSLWETY